MQTTREIRYFEQIDSTNNYLNKLLKEGAAIEKLAIVAGFQSNGRGQAENVWHSLPAQNALLSLGLIPSFLKAAEQFDLSRLVSLSIVDMLSKYLPTEKLQIKWPNDIYFDKRKIAGILISNMLNGNLISCSIVGIGVNINQAEFPAELTNAVSMAMITQKKYAVNVLISELLNLIDSRMAKMSKPEAKNNLSNEYFGRLYQFDQWHQYRIKGMEKQAKILGLSEYGQLILIDRDGEKTVCDLKEVVFL